MSIHVILSYVLATTLLTLLFSSLAAVSWRHVVLGLGLAAFFLWHRTRYVVPQEIRIQTTMMPDEVAQWRTAWTRIASETASERPVIMPVGAQRYWVNTARIDAGLSPLPEICESEIPDDTQLPLMQWQAKVDAMLQDVAQQQRDEP